MAKKLNLPYHEIKVESELPNTELAVPMICIAKKSSSGINLEGSQCFIGPYNITKKSE